MKYGKNKLVSLTLAVAMLLTQVLTMSALAGSEPTPQENMCHVEFRNFDNSETKYETWVVPGTTNYRDIKVENITWEEGWSVYAWSDCSDISGAVDSDGIIQKDCKFRPVYPATYNIYYEEEGSFVAEDGTLVQVYTETGIWGTKLKGPTIKMNVGYELYGWFDVNTGEDHSIPYELSIDCLRGHDFHAKIRDVETGTVTFEPDGGIFAGPNTVRVNTGDPVGEEWPADPTKANHTFDGWFTPDGTRFDKDTVVTEDITVQARYTDAPQAPSLYVIDVDEEGNRLTGGGYELVYKDSEYEDVARDLSIEDGNGIVFSDEWCTGDSEIILSRLGMPNNYAGATGPELEFTPLCEDEFWYISYASGKFEEFSHEDKGVSLVNNGDGTWTLTLVYKKAESEPSAYFDLRVGPEYQEYDVGEAIDFTMFIHQIGNWDGLDLDQMWAEVKYELPDGFRNVDPDAAEGPYSYVSEGEDNGKDTWLLKEPEFFGRNDRKWDHSALVYRGTFDEAGTYTVPVTLTDNNGGTCTALITIVVNEPSEVLGEIKFHKQDASEKGKPYDLESGGISNVVFEVYKKGASGAYDEKVPFVLGGNGIGVCMSNEVAQSVEADEYRTRVNTDSSGTLFLQELPVGQYHLVEVQAASGYSLFEDGWFFEIDSTGSRGSSDSNVVRHPYGKTTYFSIYNEKISGNLQLKKVGDNNTSMALAGARFELRDGAGALVTKDAYGDAIVATQTTGASGLVSYEKLKPGTYTLKETVAPVGYYLTGDEIWTVEVSNTGATTVTRGSRNVSLVGGVMTIVNKQNANEELEVLKVGAGTNAALAGATFNLTGTGYNQTKTTDADGIARFTGLSAGTYTMTETQAPAGYVRSTSTWTISVAVDGTITGTDIVNGRITVKNNAVASATATPAPTPAVTPTATPKPTATPAVAGASTSTSSSGGSGTVAGSTTTVSDSSTPKDAGTKIGDEATPLAFGLPGTGDTRGRVLWVLGLVLALAGICAIVVSNRRRKKNGEQ